MDNKTAKEILSAYRPNGSDALDEKLHEALQHAERDPELKAWFEEERRFDKMATSALLDTEVPAEGKERLLNMLEMEDSSPAPQKNKVTLFWRMGIGLAALLVLGLFLPKVFDKLSPDLPSPEEYVVSNENFSLAQLIHNAMPLHRHDNDPQVLADWLVARGAPVPKSFTDVYQQAIAQGCKVFKTSEGGTISLVCFKVDGELLHVFVFDDKARSLMDHPSRQWWREGEWNMMAMNDGSQLIALATHADRARIEQML